MGQYKDIFKLILLMRCNNSNRRGDLPALALAVQHKHLRSAPLFVQVQVAGFQREVVVVVVVVVALKG